MNIKDFYQLVQLERDPEPDMLKQLQYLTQRYPYFQAGLFIYIKCLYIHDDPSFREELRRLAPFVIDRKALFYYVMNNQFKDFEKQAVQKLTEDRTNILINAFFETLSNKEDEERELEHAIVNSSMASMDYFSYLESTHQTEVSTKEKSKTELLLDSLDASQSIESFDYPEIQIKTNLSEDIILEEIVEEVDTPTLKHHSIIDDFIIKAENKDEALININKTELANQDQEREFDDPDMDGSTEEELDDDIFFTQTLANIYIKQKKYNRAYEIIKRLSLNYPEKNIYFADQLSFLEKLIKNTNKINK